MLYSKLHLPSLGTKEGEKMKKKTKQVVIIKYNGKLDKDLDERLAGLLEFPPLNFEWIGQGYDLQKKIRDISFERTKK